jgi:hypothetical protein
MWIDWMLIAIGLLGALVFFFGLRRLRHGQPLRGGMQGLAGLVLMAAAAVSFFIALNLYTYHRFTRETPIAELNFKRTAPQHYRALLTPENETSQVLELEGDEWQLDARVLKLTGFATMIGLDGGYKLERLSGRYRSVERARRGPHTVHPLTGTGPGLDTWVLVLRYGAWLPLVDAVYGNAAYLPMADSARFEVSIGTQGLIARPLNDEAKQALRDWR